MGDGIGSIGSFQPDYYGVAGAGPSRLPPALEHYTPTTRQEGIECFEEFEAFLQAVVALKNPTPEEKQFAVTQVSNFLNWQYRLDYRGPTEQFQNLMPWVKEVFKDDLSKSTQSVFSVGRCLQEIEVKLNMVTWSDQGASLDKKFQTIIDSMHGTYSPLPELFKDVFAVLKHP